MRAKNLIENSFKLNTEKFSKSIRENPIFLSHYHLDLKQTLRKNKLCRMK